MELIALVFEAMRPKDRHVIEDMLKYMGFSVDGGGTFFAEGKRGGPTASDIEIKDDKLFCLVCGIKMAREEFVKEPCCKQCSVKYNMLTMLKEVKE